MGFFTAFRESAYPTQPFAPLPRDAEFSLRTAGALVWAAQLAYEVEAPAKFARVIARWGWQVSAVFVRNFQSRWQRAKAKGFVARAGDVTIIAFAGTEPEDPVSLMQDFTIWYSGDGVHQGFQNGVEAAATEILAVAKQASGGIYLTGHSLGAALAGVAALRLAELPDGTGDRILGVYTAGMPRIGDAAYASRYDDKLKQRTFRLVHGRDLVTRVPPEAVLGYRHVGRWLAAPRGDSFAGMPTDAPSPPDQLPPLGHLTPGLNNGAPPYPGDNVVSIGGVALLPAVLRDHLTDGYLRALHVLD